MTQENNKEIKDLVYEDALLVDTDRYDFVESAPIEFRKVDEGFANIYKKRTWEDVKKAAAATVANNSTAITAVNLGAMAAAATVPVVGIPANIALRAAIPTATAGFAFLSNMLKTDEEFWRDYEATLSEVNEDSALSDFQRGLGNAITLGSLDQTMLKHSGMEIVGEVVGGIARDVVFSSVLGAGGSLFKSRLMDGFKLSGTMAVTNAISTYNRVNGIEKDEDKAMKAAIANGVASGVAGLTFMSLIPYVSSRVSTKLFDSTLFKAAEFSGWGFTENYVNNMVMSEMGEKPNMPEMDATQAAVLFGAGAVLFGSVNSAGKMMNWLKTASERRLSKDVMTKTTASVLVDKTLKSTIKPTENILGIQQIDLDPSAVKEFAKIARNKVKEGMKEDDAVLETISVLSTDYINEKNITNILNNM